MCLYIYKYRIIIVRDYKKVEQMNINEVITKRLDSLPFSRWHIGMILAIGTIWIFDGYQVSLVSLFSKYILNDHSQAQYRSLANMYQVGCILGSFVFGLLAYYFGRRAVFMVTLIIYAIGVIFCLFGDIFALFMLGRLLTGISVGGEFTAIFTAVDEFLPPKVRGRADIIIDGSWHLGGCMASIINLAIGEIAEWKYLFAVGLFGLLGLACIRRSIPQSPRWLIMKNKRQQAQNIVSGIEKSVLNNTFFYRGLKTMPSQLDQKNTRTQRKFQSIQKQSNQKFSSQEVEANHGQLENNLQINIERQSILQPQPLNKQSIFTQLFLIVRQYKVRFFISCFLIYVQAFFFNSVYYQYPILLKDKHAMTQTQISGYMLGLSVCSFISTLLVGPFFDISGRRIMLLITYGVTGILLPFSKMLQQNALNLQVLTCIIFMFGSPASSAANLVASQIFPTSTRPIVLSLIFMVGMFGGMCGVWVDNYYVSGGLMLLGGILGYILCPKAENKSLEQINNLSQDNN